jgi:hypothetical protein
MQGAPEWLRRREAVAMVDVMHRLSLIGPEVEGRAKERVFAWVCGTIGKIRRSVSLYKRGGKATCGLF